MKKYFFFLTALFLLGISVGAIAREDSNLQNIWVQSYLKMHSSLMPVKTQEYLIVIHNDLIQLKQAVSEYELSIEVEESQFKNVAYLELDSRDNKTPQLIRQLPFVQFVTSKNIIFFCH
ncbi:MAG: hypothetical protein CL398_11355 [Acidiferrobacteraceae bacterium]|nr:hypothetical protein [Acidiferrobacteraceae bacterium]|tara:strand:- start:511 stop:867 length:357 start_codon:yes stop_codon:yes gene_type:complete